MEMDRPVLPITPTELEEINNFSDLLKHFKTCLKARRVKERPGDLGYFFVEAINEVLPKKHLDIESPEAIEEIKKGWEKIIASAQRVIWRNRKKLKIKEFTYGGDPNVFLGKLKTKNLGWGLYLKTRVLLPSDKFLSQKIKIMASHDYEDEMEPSAEDFDYVVLRQMDLLGNDSSIREIIDTEGGSRVADIVRIIIQLRPVKISARAVSERLDIPKRTVERRLGWIKANMGRIERLLEAEIEKRNPELFISSLLEERP
jgi:hypothetical protein